jgi:hypothetical protein
MEPQSLVKELERINRIAYSRIFVSEESATYILFYQRREIAQKIVKSNHSKETDDYLRESLGILEEQIKQYLNL